VLAARPGVAVRANLALKETLFISSELIFYMHVF
jgi:hypothetical protein